MTADRFVTFNGYLWPAADTECRKVAFETAADLNLAYEHVTDWSVCVQAGGNCGVWPNVMSARFGTVYTFEPDADNFHCLARNCTAPNIIKLQAALGDGQEPIALDGRRENCGAYQVAGAGSIPVLCIDDLMLRSCGLIYLDIEGYELMALRGAVKTLARCRPVIAIENKGMSDRYGIYAEQIEQAIVAKGYRVVARPNRDVIFAPC